MKLRFAVIPAAGLGTRFLPATKSVPKELLPIVDKPIIQYIVEEALASGIHKIILVINQGKEALMEHFSRSAELEKYLIKRGRKDLLRSIAKISSTLKIVSVYQEKPLGLGHAVLCARDVVGREPFAVLLGDDLFDSPVPGLLQMRSIFESHRRPVIGLWKVRRDECQRYGIIDGTRIGRSLFKINRLVEKPSPRNAPSNIAVIGRYILLPEIFDALEKTGPGNGGEIQLTDALQGSLSEGPIYGLILKGERYDAGDKKDFLRANLAYAWKRREYRKDLEILLASRFFNKGKRGQS